MRLEDFDTGERYRARVLSNTAITAPAAAEEVRELVLEVERHDFSYAIGQSVGVIVTGPFSQGSPPTLDLGHPHHFRLYTVADIPRRQDSGKPEIKLCVKRCNYIDEYSGERYPGIASNYLCNSRRDDVLTINGPFGLPFEKITGDLVFGAETFADVKHLELEGPMVSATVTGHVAQSERGWNGPLDLEIELSVQDPMARSMMQGGDVQLDASGKAKIKVKGSLSNPVVRGGTKRQQLDPFG